MLLVICPNLGIDRILRVENFHAGKVQRSQSVIVQPGGKGSNVARVFRQLGGDVALIGFVGRGNARAVTEPLRRMGIQADLIPAFDGESRTCTIVCDETGSHPTVINEESPPIDKAAEARLWTKVRRWIPRCEGVLTTGSLSTGLPVDLYARILDYARSRRKITSIDAAGEVLRVGLLVHPDFIKPNMEEFTKLTGRSITPAVFPLAPHTALTFGKAGAVLIHEGKCLYGAPPRLFDTNPIGAGDAFVATYLRYLLNRRPARECLRFAIAAAASDSSTLRPGLIDISQFRSLASRVELRFL